MMTDKAPEQLPVAVYGTLRVGYGNSRLLAGRTAELTTGVVEGHELVVDGLPFARPSATGRVVVELMWLLPHLYDQVLGDLDRLEGYDPDRTDSLYVRTEVTVDTANGDVQAWLYEAGERAQARLRFQTAVRSGDYATVRGPAQVVIG